MVWFASWSAGPTQSFTGKAPAPPFQSSPPPERQKCTSEQLGDSSRGSGCFPALPVASRRHLLPASRQRVLARWTSCPIQHRCLTLLDVARWNLHTQGTLSLNAGGWDCSDRLTKATQEAGCLARRPCPAELFVQPARNRMQADSEVSPIAYFLYASLSRAFFLESALRVTAFRSPCAASDLHFQDW